jgi:hypothetical protein
VNDSERFTEQMDQTLEALRDAIGKLPVPLAQKDSILGLIKDLREFAYQAGRGEASSTRRGQEAEPGNAFRYMKEFGSSIKVEPQIQMLVLDGLMTDESWHDHAAAHFERVMSNGNVLLLWIAEEYPDEREDELMPRYAVEFAGKEGTAEAEKRQVLATEDTEEACRFVRQLIEVDLKLRPTGGGSPPLQAG